MGNFLIDEILDSYTITDKALRRIDKELQEIVTQYNKDNHNAKIYYLIKFDRKGYIVDNIETLLQYFEDAQEINTIYLEVTETTDWHREQIISLKFNNDSSDTSVFTVTNNQKEWTEATFYRLKNIISKYKNKSYIFRDWKFEALLQISAVLILFIGSLYLAQKTYVFLSVDHPFLIAFVGWLLLFSNLWTYTMLNIRALIKKFYPFISFKENRTKTYLFRIFWTIILAPFFIWALSILSQYLQNILSVLFK